MNWRTGKQVRERYLNQLQGTINQEKRTEEVDKLILKLYKKFGTKWSYISSFLNGRPENMRRYQCDLGDSDDEDFEEESLNSSDEDKKDFKRTIKIKKVQVSEENVENFQRMTRSKNQKQNDDSLKQDSPNEDQNNENNSGLQNITTYPSNNIPQVNYINIKEENQLKCDNCNNNNSSINQQIIPQINLIPTTQINPFSFNPQFLSQQQNGFACQQNNMPTIPDNFITLQYKQPKFDRIQMSYPQNQFPRINFVNPYLGILQQQQLLNLQIPIQSQFTGLIDPINQLTELYKTYSNQMLSKNLQP